MKGKINKGLKEYQQSKRLETQKKIIEAIDELKEEGYEITTGLLMERTGFSRSTFSKKHVKEILRDTQVGRFKNTKKVDAKDMKEYIDELEKKVKKLQSDNKKLTINLDKQIKRNRKLELEIAEKEDNLQTLRGQLMVLYQKASNRGIDLD